MKIENLERAKFLKGVLKNSEQFVSFVVELMAKPNEAAIWIDKIEVTHNSFMIDGSTEYEAPIVEILLAVILEGLKKQHALIIQEIETL